MEITGTVFLILFLVFVSDLGVVVAFLALVPVVVAFSWACVFRWWLLF
jgi:hypothetical protein